MGTSRVTVVDVTESWHELVPGVRGAWPHHGEPWGRTVSAVFGGRFRVLRVDGTRPGYAPVLVGGMLAPDGFCSGHIGYGGVLPADGGPPLALVEQRDSLALLESSLGVECVRLVVPPDHPHDGASLEERETVLVPLTEDDEERWARYHPSVRARIRRCRREGLTTGDVTAAEVAAAAELIRATQAKVGSSYLIPDGLLDRMVDEGPRLGFVLGCRLEGRLVAVGAFLRGHGRAAYVFNGWASDVAAIAPNYLLVDEALRRSAAGGDEVFDMGFSHRASLREVKERWGGQRAALYVASRPRGPRVDRLVHNVRNGEGT